MIVLLAFIGLVLCVYALWVMHHMETKKYKPLCDINEYISCTKAFGSSTAKLSGLPNPTVGVFYFALVISLFKYAPPLAEPIIITGCIISVYLAFVSYVQQRNFCLVCTAIYAINFGMLYYI